MVSVLVVDDDRDFRRMLESVLERAGFEVDTAANGEIALKCFAAKQSELIMLDMVMPQKEGVETIIELKKKYPEVKIIAMSGGGRMSPTPYLQLAAHLGAVATLRKPFSREELEDTLTRALAR